MIGWRLFLLGVFLTPFTRVLPIPGFGLSIGDIALVAGAVLVLAGRARRPRAASWGLAAFLMPCALIVVGTLVSVLVNQTASAAAAFILVSQYAVVLFLLPLVLARETPDRLADATKAYVYGLGVSVAVGLVIISFLPGIEGQLTARGWMFSVAGGERHGLFAGIGELSKMSAMGLGLLYYLALRGHVSVIRAGGLFGAMLVALVVTRSGSGAATAVAIVAALAAGHLGVRSSVRRQATPGGGLRGLVVACAGVVGGALALRELDSRGTGYREAFIARIAQPLGNEGYEGVGSARLREQLVEQAWQIIGQHPVVGIGPGLYHQDALYGQGAHVVPLMLWAETGILTLLGWLVLVLGLGLTTWTRMRRAPIAAVAAGGVLVALLATHLSAPYMYGRGLFLPMLLAFYLLADTGEAKRDEVETGDLIPSHRTAARRR